MNEELQKQRKEILEQLETFTNGSYFTVNKREYKITKLSHQFRLEVVALYSQIEAQLTMGNYGFFVNEDFKKIMKKIDEKILFDDIQISKKPNHFEEFAEDYLDYVALSMKVISYPFYKTKLNIN